MEFSIYFNAHNCYILISLTEILAHLITNYFHEKIYK